MPALSMFYIKFSAKLIEPEMMVHIKKILLENDRRQIEILMKKSNAIIKTDLAENWEKAVNYIPDSFTIIVYEYENVPPKIKIGDGIHKLSAIPFLIQQREVDGNMLIL